MECMNGKARFWAAMVPIVGLARLAFAGDGYEPPGVEKPNYWWSILVAAVALAGICVIGFKNAKRTHLD